jgi:hypothetical protein
MFKMAQDQMGCDIIESEGSTTTASRRGDMVEFWETSIPTVHEVYTRYGQKKRQKREQDRWISSQFKIKKVLNNDGEHGETQALTA